MGLWKRNGIFAISNLKHTIIMKKLFIVLGVVLLVAVAFSACAHKTCPAYRGSVSMAE